MNIFVTDNCPIISAQALDNKRVVKMVLETAQLLSTALFINGVITGNIYKPTHMKHPCTIWAATNIGNWNWLLEHFIALCKEYSIRYNKNHKSANLLPYFLEYKTVMKEGEITPFVNCTKSELIKVDFGDLEDTCTAYRQYLTMKWQHDKLMPRWINREPPLWYSLPITQ